MKIGLITAPWIAVPPTSFGGTEAVIDLQARGFLKAGHDVLLFTVGKSTCPVPKRWIFESTDGYDSGTTSYELQHAIAAYETMVEEKVDIVHDHTLSGLIWGERYPQLNVVATNHGPFSPERNDIFRQVANRVSIVGISNSQALRAPKEIPVRSVIHHGLNSEEFPLGDGQGDYLLFIGRMGQDRGVVEAARIARASGKKLIIAAKMETSSEREYFIQQVQPFLSTEIIYVGEVGWNEKLKLLSDAEALIDPVQWNEPFGLVMIESLACGTPVISTRMASAPEIIDQGETGFLCNDLNDMLDAVARIPEIDRKRCRTAVEGHFSAKRMVDEHLQLYEELLKLDVIDVREIDSLRGVVSI